ncbi:MAG: hypothetical protein ACFFDH_10635 [Promethearchaeota archaeon]
MELNTIQIGQSTPHHMHNGTTCVICKGQLGSKAKIFKEGLSFGVVCETCYKNNSLDDLEFMGNLFKAYGGYFGMIKDLNYSLFKVLKSLKVSEGHKKINLGRNIKELHQALLHGISLNQFRQGLKIMSDF